GRRDRPVSRRLAGAVRRFDRMDLVPRESGGAAVLLRVDAVDAAAIPLRPADGVRLEGAAAGRRGQPAGDGGGGAVFWPLRRSPSTCSAPSRSPLRCWSSPSATRSTVCCC